MVERKLADIYPGCGDNLKEKKMNWTVLIPVAVSILKIIKEKKMEN